MALLPVTTCAQMLGIHPKTLHHWLNDAHVPLALHPSDARIKCVTPQDLQAVASLHGRSLLELPVGREEQTRVLPLNEAGPEPSSSPLPPPLLSEADVIQKIFSLEAKVASLQEQLTHLALALLHERDRPRESRLTPLETMTAQRVEKPVVAPSLADLQRTQPLPNSAHALFVPPSPNPGEGRTRPQLALIEYGAGGSYVILCPHEGELPLIPDSAEWFAWLASLSSFRFVGKEGRLSASRVCDHGPKRSWYAYRCIHQHTYKHYLGTTDRLTISRLEQVATALQSHTTSL